MELRVHTESGSIYLINKDKMTWDRVKYPTDPKNISAFPVRTKGGDLSEWPKVEIGSCMNLIGPPITFGATGRLVQTSPVVKIEEVSSN